LPTDNARPNTNVTARNDSPIIGLKRFNNWVKSVLIAKHGRRENADAPKVRVLDLGCGKGGDLPKWSKAGTAEYVGIGAFFLHFLPLCHQHMSGRTSLILIRDSSQILLSSPSSKHENATKA
jgi:hypothetical protein